MAQSWRSVGPSRGGRSVAVAGDPDDPAVFWFGACAGGVWRTDDGGTYWRNVSDGHLTSSSVGAIAVAHARRQTVWVGTGESCTRNNVVAGDGVYRTTDGGQSWSHQGLAETRHIARVRIRDEDPDDVWVAALGDIFGPNPERGVFRTRDGGESWDHVLFVDAEAGAADLSLHPTDPDVAFASIWQAVRKPWEMVSGGPHSDLYRTTDGGRTWEPMSGKTGFPTTLKGRIGVSVSPCRPERVYAVVEAAEEQSGIYRSDDGGESWALLNAESDQTGRPWYYSHVFADPVDPDTVWTCNLWFWRSRDGGETFSQVQTPHGDNHDLWLDPRDPRRMVQANDGGACVSYNGGRTFSSVYNQSTAQIYRVDVSPRFPFDLYGTQQDNSGIRVPSRSWKGAIRWPDCLELGEAEAGDVACDPLDDRFVFVGGAGFGHPGPLLRFDQVTEQAQDVAVWVEHFMGTAPSTHRHRFGWTYPIQFSRHDPTVLYVCGERVFRSADAGMSWEPLSGDLTTDDPALQRASGGPINKDTSGAEVFCTIHAFADSLADPDVLWAGSDDGLVHVTADGGGSWRPVTPPDLPSLATVTAIEPSASEPGTAYVAAHRYRLQDRRPYLYRTTDQGETWADLTGGLPDDCVLRCLLVDPVRPSVLYLGTDHGVLVSTDEAATWAPLGDRLPPVPVYDLALRDHELVAATHGRGFWVLDDLTPVREGERDDGLVTLFTPPTTYRYPTPTGFEMKGEGTWVGGFPGVPLGGASFTRETGPDGREHNVVIDGGENPPDGLAVRYRLAAPVPERDVRIEVRDPDGTLLRVLPDPWGEPPAEDAERAVGEHCTVWDLRTTPALGPGDDGPEPITPGPRVPPGRYRVAVVAGDERREAEVTVLRDPRLPSDDEALRQQYDLLARVRDALADAGRALLWLDERLADDALPEGERAALAESRRVIGGQSSGHGDDLKQPPGLTAKIKLLPEIVSELSDTAPTAAVRQVWAELSAQLDEQLAGLAGHGWTR
jgi:photosystem II stability/assembly factor-like uncharacterized protein